MEIDIGEKGIAMNMLLNDNRPNKLLPCWTQEDDQCWSENGYYLLRHAVPKFYILRLLYFLNGNGHPVTEFNHPYIWDIRMQYKVYEAFAGLWNEHKLWMTLDKLEIDTEETFSSEETGLNIGGFIPLVDTLLVCKDHYVPSELDNVNVNAGDLVPAQDTDELIRCARIHFWNKTNHTERTIGTGTGLLSGKVVLSQLGEKLLGLTLW